MRPRDNRLIQPYGATVLSCSGTRYGGIPGSEKRLDHDCVVFLPRHLACSLSSTKPLRIWVIKIPYEEFPALPFTPRKLIGRKALICISDPIKREDLPSLKS